MEMVIYHSAMSPPIDDIKPSNKVSSSAGVAFVHDITTGLPNEFDSCDILYTEMAWRNGYSLFQCRARVSESSSDFTNYQKAIAQIAQSCTKPFVLITGKDALRRLPEPNQKVDTKLNRGDCIAAIYGFEYHGPKGDTLEIISNLADEFNRVGDFCCGYGNAGRVFAKAGKKFVMSDFNPYCIGYIASQGWAR